MNNGTIQKGPSVLAIGSELLDGRVHESNSLFVARFLADLGLSLSGVSLCDDVESEIIDALDLLAKNASIILLSGGLGPTTDDLTREAVARYCNVELYEDSESLNEIKALFEKRKRHFNPTNKKQAMFPVGSTIVKNPVGTAPGFAIETVRNNKKLLLIALPGVPSEFNRMFTETVAEMISTYLGGVSPPKKRIIRTFGLSESEIGGRIESLALDKSLTISYRAAFPEIQVKILHTDGDLVDQAAQRVERILGEDFIFARSLDLDFEEVVFLEMRDSGETVAFAESCTGGNIGNIFTNPAGSSRVFLGSAVVYANQAKTSLIDVPVELIQRHGAVSAEVAEAMARGAKRKYQSTYALSVTGIAGPDGGSNEKPVGTFHVGLAHGENCTTFKLFFLSSRKSFKQYVAYVVLDILRRHRKALSLSPYQGT